MLLATWTTTLPPQRPGRDASAAGSIPTLDDEVRAAIAAVSHAVRVVRRRISEFLDPLDGNDTSSSSAAASGGSGRQGSPVDEEDTAAGAMHGKTFGRR